MASGRCGRPALGEVSRDGNPNGLRPQLDDPARLKSTTRPGPRSAFRRNPLSRPVVLTVNSIRLAQSRESRDASAHGRHSQTDLVGGNRALPITSFAHMGRFGSRDEIHTRMNNTPAAVSVSKV